MIKLIQTTEREGDAYVYHVRKPGGQVIGVAFRDCLFEGFEPWCLQPYRSKEHARELNVNTAATWWPDWEPLDSQACFATLADVKRHVANLNTLQEAHS